MAPSGSKNIQNKTSSHRAKSIIDLTSDNDSLESEDDKSSIKYVKLFGGILDNNDMNRIIKSEDLFSFKQYMDYKVPKSIQDILAAMSRQVESAELESKAMTGIRSFYLYKSYYNSS